MAGIDIGRGQTIFLCQRDLGDRIVALQVGLLVHRREHGARFDGIDDFDRQIETAEGDFDASILDRACTDRRGNRPGAEQCLDCSCWRSGTAP